MRSFTSRVEAGTSTCRWHGFLDWLAGDGSRAMPPYLWRFFSSLRLRWIVQQEAGAFSSRLLALLAERQRAGLTLTQEAYSAVGPQVAKDIVIRPLTADELAHMDAWGVWQTAGELLRLLRLVEAPSAWLSAHGWDARNRALAACLIRLWQRWRVLERWVGAEAAQQERLQAADLAWQQAVGG